MKRKDNKMCETNMSENDRIILKKKEDTLFKMLRNNDIESKSSLNSIWIENFYNDIKNIANKIENFSNQSNKKEAYKKYMLAFNINVNDACIYFKDILINIFKIYDERKLDYILYIKKHAKKTNNILFLKYLYNINVLQEDISICPFSCDNYTNNVIDKFYKIYNKYDESKEIKRLHINLEICRKCICNIFKFLGDLFRYKYKIFNGDEKENEFNSYINYYRSLYYSRSNGYLFTQLSLLYTNINPIKALYFHFLSLISYQPSKSRDTIIIYMEKILDKRNTEEAILQFVKDVYQFNDEHDERDESDEEETDNNSDHTCVNNKKIKRIIKKRSKSIEHRRKSRKSKHSHKRREYNNSSIEHDIETCSSIEIHSHRKNVTGTYSSSSSSSSGRSCSENGNDTCSSTKSFRSNTNKKTKHDYIDDEKNGKNRKNEHRRNRRNGRNGKNGKNGSSGDELTKKEYLRKNRNKKKMYISKKKNKRKSDTYKELKETIVKFYISYFKIMKLLFSKIDMNKFEKKKNKFMYYTNKYVKIQYYNKIDNDLIFKNIIVIVFTLLSMIIYIITNQYEIKRNRIDKFFYGKVDINKYIYKNEQIYFSFILIHEILLSCKSFYNNFDSKYLSIFIYIMYWIHNEPSLNNTHITKLDEEDNEEKNNLIKQYHEYYKKKATVGFGYNNYKKKYSEKQKCCKNTDHEYLKNSDIINSIKNLIYSIKIKEDVKFDIRLLYYILDEDSCVHPFLNDLEFLVENIQLPKYQDNRNSQINTYSIQELSDFDDSDEEDIIFLKKTIFGKPSSFSTDKKLKKEKNKLSKYNELYENYELCSNYESTSNDSCSGYSNILSNDKKKKKKKKVKQYENFQKINNTNLMVNKNKHKKNDEEIYQMDQLENKIRIIRFYSILNSKNKIDTKNKMSEENKSTILKQTNTEYLKTNIKKNNSKRIKMIKNIEIFSKDVKYKQADNDPLVSCIIANKKLKKKSENTDSPSDDMNNKSDTSDVYHSDANHLKSESENSKIAMITNSNHSDEDTEDKSLYQIKAHKNRRKSGSRNSSSGDSDTRKSDTRKSDTRKSDTRKIGSRSSGSRNSGSRNSGSRSSGSRNSSSGDSDTRKSDTRKSDTRKIGSRSSGSRNSGSRNTGSRNSSSGDSDTRKSDTRKSDTRKSDTRKTGSRNSGSRNSGSRNSGSRNSSSRDGGSRDSGSRNSSSRNSTSGYVSNDATSEDYEDNDSKINKTILNKLCDSKKLTKRQDSLNNNTDIIKTYHENIIPKNEETPKRGIDVCHISVKNNNEDLYNNRKNILNDIYVQKNSNFGESTKCTKLEYLPFSPTQKDSLYDCLQTSIINNGNNNNGNNNNGNNNNGNNNNGNNNGNNNNGNSSSGNNSSGNNSSVNNEIKKGTYEEIVNDVIRNYRNKKEGDISLNILNSNLYFNERNKKVVLLDGKNIGTRYQSNYIKYFDIFRIKTVLDYYKLNEYKVKIIIPQEYVIQHSDTLNIRQLIQNKSQKESTHYTSNGIDEKNYHINANYYSNNHIYKNNGYDINNKIVENNENIEFSLNTKDLLFFKHLNMLGCLITHPLENYYQFCIYIIQKFNSGFVTNITISELASKLHKYEQAIQPIFPHLISYTFLGDEFLPNPDFKWPISNNMG
ncbi:tetratricopeptide repeat protein, putative [Plasmodium yoelii]|uniref:Tetratricopeptide repeat protein n=2 Tax=Plasmodium yoelii TaxID=5861 RepID=A0AAE9WPW8_PLAYO|nr:tetratricopeptide repeat protein, putative [Plasmodium yoelii]WBY56856.1 tetratricopeptide repeat protein [Plasmodium yoelii yoelii]VTZ77608.1 tetratricopeptide repeat protein, putative [Plasmodium yoelii]|eukprot:XP_730514.3 tetratricopeptide repeat protein, putative [Plasmodium yoelii]